MAIRWNTYKSFLRKRGNLLVLLLLILISLFYQLIWLALGIIVLAILYFLLLKGVQKFIKSARIQLFVRRGIQFLFILMCCICGRLFVIDVYKIPSKSMENTLFAEDVIVVNKLSYGPTIPRSISEIPWIGLFFSTSKESHNTYKRLSGIRDIQYGDVVVFQRSKGKFVVKRCVGIAGDEFQINDGIISINGQTYEESANTKKRYQVHVSNPETFHQELKTLSLEVTADPVRNKATIFEMYLTSEERSKVFQLTSVEKTNILSDAIQRAYVGDIAYYDDWNGNNLGPVIIPKKGMQIRWNDTNFQQYKATLKKYEKVTVTQKGNQFYTNGILSTAYTFQKDYLFLMGDNRLNSQDSRHYGFVPQEQVVGKVSYVVYSKYDGVFQWNRLFKKVPENPQKK